MVVAGRLNGVQAPEGTILGPTWTRELLAVDSNDETGITLRYAQVTDTERSTDDPHSVTEFKKNQLAQLPIVDRLRYLFGAADEDQ